jgi:hypothetical protein
MQLGGHGDFYVLLFGVVYLACYDFAMDPTKEQRVCRKPLKNCYRGPVSTACLVLGLSDIHWGGPAYRKSPDSLKPKLKSKVKSMLIIFFDIKRLFKQNSSWQAKHLIPHTNVTTGYCIITTHHLTSFFTREFFEQKQHDCRPPTIILAWPGPLQLFNVSLIEDKTER